MARYTGPRTRRARRLGVALAHLSGKDPDKDSSLRKPYPPGQHGPDKMVKRTEYGVRLLEKQKLKLAYELLEHQCRKVVARAKRTGENAASQIQVILERRFDVMVYRAGFATSLRQARQLVRHGSFTLDGAKANMPGQELRPGVVIKLKERFHHHALFVSIFARVASRQIPGHIKKNGPFEFTVTGEPLDVEPLLPIELTRVIEFYA
ncbi:MAG: 30S ribosomal protein S4 [Archangium gephyra]|uniref:Small ribosomal subunit protein uS4 n=1 Tax=Archangium gephyra TaxID=48 RepID=A0A2W5TDD7_9BACT|nr:MAG: 30S ribosomal protein S4 [Archangium gephyra]